MGTAPCSNWAIQPTGGISLVDKDLYFRCPEDPITGFRNDKTFIPLLTEEDEFTEKSIQDEHGIT